MSLEKKLEREYLRGYLDGASAAYRIVENGFKLIDGIGPKTQEKIKEAIRKQYEAMQGESQ